MTVSSTTVKNSYSGDGSQTTFVYGYKIFADSDIKVIIRKRDSWPPSTQNQPRAIFSTKLIIMGVTMSGWTQDSSNEIETSWEIWA